MIIERFRREDLVVEHQKEGSATKVCNVTSMPQLIGSFVLVGHNDMIRLSQDALRYRTQVDPLARSNLGSPRFDFHPLWPFISVNLYIYPNFLCRALQCISHGFDKVSSIIAQHSKFTFLVWVVWFGFGYNC